MNATTDTVTNDTVTNDTVTNDTVTNSTALVATSPAAGSLMQETVLASRGSAIVSGPLDWLWPDRVPLGKLTLLVGDPEQGKSFLTLDMAARVTRGLPWPDDAAQPAPQGSVVVLTAEDQANDTVVPRLVEAGADLDRCWLLQAIRGADGLARALSLDRDLSLLRRTLLDVPDCRLVVIDPISSYLGQIDGNSNTNLRSLLFPLSELAAERGVAVVMVSHLNKRAGARAMYRTTGSMAFVAVSRAAWLVVRDPQNEQRRLLLSIKSNLAAPAPGLAFHLAASEDQPIAHVEWDAEPVDESLAQALDIRRAFNIKEQLYRDRESWAVTWLRERLSDGPQRRELLWLQASGEGISTDQMYRAAKRLGVVMKKRGMLWDDAEWMLPEHADRAQRLLIEAATEEADATPSPRKKRTAHRRRGQLRDGLAAKKNTSEKPASKKSVNSLRAKLSMRSEPIDAVPAKPRRRKKSAP